MDPAPFRDLTKFLVNEKYSHNLAPLRDPDRDPGLPEKLETPCPTPRPVRSMRYPIYQDPGCTTSRRTKFKRFGKSRRDFPRIESYFASCRGPGRGPESRPSILNILRRTASSTVEIPTPRPSIYFIPYQRDPLSIPVNIPTPKGCGDRDLSLTNQ
jgi:hypothetical protein